MNPVTRRVFVALAGGSVLAWVTGDRVRDTARLAAAHLVAALDLHTLGPLAARVDTPRVERHQIEWGELVTRICNLSPARILELTPASLRAHFQERTRADYAAGRLTRIDGWWLAHTEVHALALAARARV